MADPKSVLAALGASVFAKKDFSQLGQLMREDYIQHNPLVPQGSRGFREFFEAWFGAVPDFKYELKKIASEGDLVWAYGTYSGTQKGDWLGIPATGKIYTFDAVDIFRVQDGKLAEHWDVLERLWAVQTAGRAEVSPAPGRTRHLRATAAATARVSRQRKE